MKMKGGDFYGIKGKQILLTLIAVFCTVLLVWAWEKTPLAATFLLQKEKFGIVPRDFIVVGADYVKNTSYDLKLASQEVDTSHSGQLGQQYEQRDKAFGAPQKGLSMMNVAESMKNNEDLKFMDSLDLASSHGDICRFIFMAPYCSAFFGRGGPPLSRAHVAELSEWSVRPPASSLRHVSIVRPSPLGTLADPTVVAWFKTKRQKKREMHFTKNM